jgi:hypothetical protein
MIQKLKNKLESLYLFISPTTTSKSQFEKNIKNEFICEHLHHNIEMLEKHFNYIGKEVYQYSKNKSVTTIEDFKLKESEDLSHSLLNPIDKKPFVYTIEQFNDFEKWYVKYQIEFLSKGLVDRSPYLNSTNPFSNLEFQWIIESKQKLIEFYNEMLN